METTLFKAESRGHANHGWLDSYHSFSFANYYNPGCMNFGMLRVLNDDKIDAGTGFGAHPHDNMEIISIPLKGAIEHKDSMGNIQTIRAGEVQIMSAGSGITHSEYNQSKSEQAEFLQIWVFPNVKDSAPRYGQREFPAEERKNAWQTIVSPDGKAGLAIQQDAWFHLGDWSAGSATVYSLQKPGNGIYVFVLKGQVKIQGETLGTRDAIGVTGAGEIAIEAFQDTELLVIEVPVSKM